MSGPGSSPRSHPSSAGPSPLFQAQPGPACWLRRRYIPSQYPPMCVGGNGASTVPVRLRPSLVEPLFQELFKRVSPRIALAQWGTWMVSAALSCPVDTTLNYPALHPAWPYPAPPWSTLPYTALSCATLSLPILPCSPSPACSPITEPFSEVAPLTDFHPGCSH